MGTDRRQKRDFGDCPVTEIRGEPGCRWLTAVGKGIEVLVVRAYWEARASGPARVAARLYLKQKRESINSGIAMASGGG